MKKLKVILSGGGTGGHIYPAVSVAEALKRKLGDNVEILFVGAEGRMEMEKIPALGYEIKGLPVAGLQRKLSASNLKLPFKVASSVRSAKRIIRDFGADVVAGFGGYASAPVLWAAQRLKVPTLIQEQNSYPGLTNKILSKRAGRICVAYDGLDRFFPFEKITHTGNPLRGSFSGGAVRSEALGYFGLKDDKPTVLIVGGSLGSRTLNNAMKRNIDKIIADSDTQYIWQTGKYYENEIKEFMTSHPAVNIWYGAFIDRMDLAYTAADVVVSRAGAGAVSELSLVGKPAIFVPSPNVSEDHQTHNAMALVNKDAAILVTDPQAEEILIETVTALIVDKGKMAELSKNIKLLGITDSADRVADEIIRLTDGV